MNLDLTDHWFLTVRDGPSVFFVQSFSKTWLGNDLYLVSVSQQSIN